MSLISDFNLIQGDSSTIYKFGESSGSILGTDWTASYSITDTNVTPNIVIITGPLSKDTGTTNFIFQILPSVSETLEVNKKYQVAVEIRNDTINYKAEVAQFKLKILPQYVQ